MNYLIAERQFHKSAPGTSVIARIFAPEPNPPDWSCKIEIDGLDHPYEKEVFGVDSLQALYLALRLLCAHLEKHEQDLAFLDGPVGDCGLPLVVPWLFGSSGKNEVYDLIERKVEERLEDDQWRR
jgi:hypothetical protein